MKDVAAFATHGGGIDVARRLFPDAPRPWLDLSTGINPVAYPIEALPARAWEALPAEADLKRLEEIARHRYGAGAGTSIVAASGTQAIIQRLPDLCAGEDVRVLWKTFGEFERVFRAAGKTVRVVHHPDALAGADVAIVVNPNNPDGRLVPAPDLLAMSERVGTLVVDEAFMDAVRPSHSVIPRLPARRVIVLRSFGKFYGLAGLRLGFAILPSDRAAALRRTLGPWAVSGSALVIGARALSDDVWREAARVRLLGDGERLMRLLRHAGAAFVGGTPLFRLIAHPAAGSLFASLAGAGILTRPFLGDPNWLRFGLPGSEPDWARLERALLAFR